MEVAGAEETGLLSNQQRSFFSSISVWKRVLIIAAALTVVVIVITVPVVLVLRPKATTATPKNIIFMIGDGFGPASLTFARTVSGAPLTLDSILVGNVQTFSYTNDITDSAAGATAYACGKKTSNIAIGVDHLDVPCGTLLEAARRKGMKTGLVATSRITHATPAGFSAHVVERDMEQLIAKQQVDAQVDVMFGGGAMFYRNLGDHLNLTDYAIHQRGYNVITTPQELAGPLRLPVIGLFAQSHMTWEIDRNATQQPSLVEMAERAINLLSENSGDSGFFLMIEGSRIDMAAHNNDPFAHNGEILMYDKTIKLVKDWVSAHPDETLMVSTADHETGGLTLGLNFKNLSYPVYEWYPDVVSKGTASCEKIAALLSAAGANITQIYAQYAGVTDLSDDEAAAVMAAKGTENFIRFVAAPISYRAKIGWTTFGHTGVDVNLYAYGVGADEMRGNFNNIDVGLFVANKFNLNLAQITSGLRGIQTVDPCYPYTANGNCTNTVHRPLSAEARRARALFHD
eukprot:TRINITY_DN10746_c0_g1_i2.p1 TRINITY_DN10746_c0_g1~~TRINITY_DN10746_c0_g1_i2.p1  ORF type:complete len:526 (-),score=167.86 TRINITY_DN10746_c0_g1_i2:346-1890(-)